MTLRVVPALERVEQVGKRQVGVDLGLETERRFQIALRLAPQLGAPAQLTERKQQPGIARLTFEPGLGVVQAGARLVDRFRTVGIQPGQAAVPALFEQAFGLRARECRVWVSPTR